MIQITEGQVSRRLRLRTHPCHVVVCAPGYDVRMGMQVERRQVVSSSLVPFIALEGVGDANS